MGIDCLSLLASCRSGSCSSRCLRRSSTQPAFTCCSCTMSAAMSTTHPCLVALYRTVQDWILQQQAAAEPGARICPAVTSQECMMPCKLAPASSVCVCLLCWERKLQQPAAEQNSVPVLQSPAKSARCLVSWHQHQVSVFACCVQERKLQQQAAEWERYLGCSHLPRVQDAAGLHAYFAEAAARSLADLADVLHTCQVSPYAS